jgi:intracellular sulfur oxidation DsrE/DsrF family protein
MKKIIFLLLLSAAALNVSVAQTQPYKVVFDLTNKDTAMQARVLRWVDLILKTNPNPEIEVVFYGQSLEMVTKSKSAFEDRVAKLAAFKNVKFAVCEQAMNVHNITKDQLIPGVLTVPDGIYEIITKQAQGFGYIKAAL